VEFSNDHRENDRITGRGPSSRDEFTGTAVPVQVKLPEDLAMSLRLLSIQTGRTMSDLVLEALTTPAVISKAWISTRRAG
jgi:hypothetical protein